MSIQKIPDIAVELSLVICSTWLVENYPHFPNNIACFVGAFAMARKIAQSEHSNWSEAFISSGVGYSVGIYFAAFICEWKTIEIDTNTAKICYLMAGASSMWFINIMYSAYNSVNNRAKTLPEDFINKKLGMEKDEKEDK